jgi:hypothetical protein
MMMKECERIFHSSSSSVDEKEILTTKFKCIERKEHLNHKTKLRMTVTQKRVKD